MSTEAVVERPLSFACRHPASIVETDTNGHIWVDSATLCMELEISAYTRSGMYLRQVEQHYGGDRNLFRRVRGRRALWDFNLIHDWYLARKLPKAGFKARYVQKLDAKGELAA